MLTRISEYDLNSSAGHLVSSSGPKNRDSISIDFESQI